MFDEGRTVACGDTLIFVSEAGRADGEPVVLRVTLHPFIMMDVPSGNELPDPYGGTEQAAYPWRGRITCHPGPGQAASADKTAAARTQVDAFLGAVAAGDFSVVGESVFYTGATDDWGFRRFILHHARLAAAAGGVDAFLIGSEMRGVSRLRDAADAFPFVEGLCALAGEIRAVLGAGTKISYGADWSEYFGHQPADGTRARWRGRKGWMPAVPAWRPCRCRR